jgi:lactoylglutathione lyase
LLFGGFWQTAGNPIAANPLTAGTILHEVSAHDGARNGYRTLLRFYRDALGLVELSRRDYPQGRYTLVFLSAPGDEQAQVELTYNWDPEAYSGGRNFGHLAYQVENIYATCQRSRITA